MLSQLIDVAVFLFFEITYLPSFISRTGKSNQKIGKQLTFSPRSLFKPIFPFVILILAFDLFCIYRYGYNKISFFIDIKMTRTNKKKNIAYRERIHQTSKDRTEDKTGNTRKTKLIKIKDPLSCV